MPLSSYSHMRSPTVDSSSRGGPLGHHDFPSLIGANIQNDTTATMVTIDSLLNPAGGHRYHEHYGNTAPPTPAYSSCTYSQGGTPRPETPLTPSPKRQKLVKDAAMFIRNRPQGEINYPASECSEEFECLAPHQRQELAQQHLNFHLYPSGRGEDGRIEDYARRIPYSSEKKEFLTKTGRDAFEVFQYTFVVPNDPNRKEHVVMWDYRIGLVRITPFFKALQHTKTTPAKALSANAGLKELAHSITGGALVAQGYWIPYACARAVCLTFCYNIRWALTPVFGPTFINECLRPGEAGFGSFKIDPEVVRCAAREAEGWRPDNYGQRIMLGPVASHHYGRPAPRSQPEEFRQPMPAPQPRGGHIRFHSDSPFGPNAHRSTGPSYTYAGPGNESPALSPKSTSYEYQDSPGWTSINKRHDEVYQQTYAGPGEPLSDSLLMEQRYAPPAPWRAADPLRSMPEQRPVESAHTQAKQALKRRHSDVDDSSDDLPDEEPEAVLSTSSESDDADLPLSPPPTRRERSSRVTRSSKKSKPATGPSGKKFTEADEQAARWLLNLSTRDSQLAREPNQFSMRNFEMSGQ